MRRIGLAVLALVLAAGTLSAQRPRRGGGGLREVRNEGSVGFDFLIAEPLDDFRRTGQVAFGIGGHAVVGLSRNSGLGLRIDGAYQMYESNYRGYGISTSSSIASLAIGPQITAGVGPIRPYAFATFGGSVFWTTVGDDGYCDCYESDVFFLNGRTTTATQLGAGVQFVLARAHTPIAIDLGVRDLRHSRVRYVPVGGILGNGDGTYTVNRVETPVRQRVFQLGLSFGIR